MSARSLSVKDGKKAIDQMRTATAEPAGPHKCWPLGVTGAPKPAVDIIIKGRTAWLNSAEICDLLRNYRCEGREREKRESRMRGRPASPGGRVITCPACRWKGWNIDGKGLAGKDWPAGLARRVGAGRRNRGECFRTATRSHGLRETASLPSSPARPTRPSLLSSPATTHLTPHLHSPSSTAHTASPCLPTRPSGLQVCPERWDGRSTHQRARAPGLRLSPVGPTLLRPSSHFFPPSPPPLFPFS